MSELDDALSGFVSSLRRQRAAGGPATSVQRAVVTGTGPLLVQVGISSTSTPAANALTAYTPVIGDVVLVARRGLRQQVIGGPL